MTTVPRIVSLIASSTEIICALGLSEHLVGRSHECDYPLWVKDLPQCTSPKFNTVGTSYEIDQQVKAIVQESLSVYRVDASMLESLRPSHIITQSQCEVCAVSLSDVEAAVCQIVKSKPVIVSLEPNSLADIWRDIELVGTACGVTKSARQLIAELKAKMEAIGKRAATAQSRPTVASIEWIDPLMAGGNWMPELVDIAGGINLFGEAGKHSPWMKWEELVEKDPDVIVIAPCGFGIERTLAEIPSLAGKKEWAKLAAVKSKRVFVADGNQYFNRPGPRVVESLEIMSELLHPEIFSFNHQGTGWLLIS